VVGPVRDARGAKAHLVEPSVLLQEAPLVHHRHPRENDEEAEGKDLAGLVCLGLERPCAPEDEVGEREGDRVGNEGIAPVVTPEGQNLVSPDGWRWERVRAEASGDEQGDKRQPPHEVAQAPRGPPGDDLHGHQRLDGVSQKPQPRPRQEPAVQGPPAWRHRLPQPDRKPDDHHCVEDRVEGERRHVRGEEGTVVEKGDQGEVAEEAEDEESGARHFEDAEEVGRRQLVAPIGGEAGGEQERRVEADQQSVLDERADRPRAGGGREADQDLDEPERKGRRPEIPEPALGGRPNGAQSPADGEDEPAQQNDDRRVLRVVLEGEPREDGPRVRHGHHEHHEERGRYDLVTPERRNDPGHGATHEAGRPGTQGSGLLAASEEEVHARVTHVRPRWLRAKARQG
jgi:hypothetical protein